jgi:hypothetical protein
MHWDDSQSAWIWNASEPPKWAGKKVQASRCPGYKKSA